MIVYNCVQGSTEWHQCRCGVITASMFETARKKLKSGPRKGLITKAGEDYAFRLAIERISGQPLDESFETWQMRRGHDLEESARIAHEIKAGLLVETAGFVTTDDGLFGASADGLIGDDGGSEYKCLVSPERLKTVLIDKNIDEFKNQVQGCLWITGRKWWHFCLYCPALEAAGKALTLIEVERDENWIEEMEYHLVEFERMVSAYELTLMAAA